MEPTLSLRRLASQLGVLLALTVIAATPALLAATPPAPPPNIVLIYADDLGYGDLGCYGAKDIQTPHIDRLATEGTRFTSFYVSQSVCTASRAALMTGSYANRVSMSGALNHTSPTGLHSKEKLLPQVFKDRGYATAIFGKWHLGHHPQFLPTRRGFDEWLGIPYSNDNGPRPPPPRHPLPAALRQRRHRRARSRPITVHPPPHRGRRLVHRA
jgi:arylsulfatase